MSSLADKLHKARADALKRQRTGRAKPASASAPAATPATAATPAPAPAAKPATTPDAPVDYASALKDQRTKLAEAKQEVSKQLGAGTPQELDAAKARLSTLQSSVKTLEGAAQRERQAKLTAAGAQPIDPAEQPFTYTNPRLVRAGPAPTGIPAEIVLLQALRDRQEDREVETSRGQLFRAGGKSPEELAAAAKDLNARLSAIEAQADDISDEKTRVQAQIENLQFAEGEDAPTFAARQDPTFASGQGFPSTVISKAAMQLRAAKDKAKELDAQETALSEQRRTLQRALVLTGSAPPAVAAAKAQEQREEVKAVPGPDAQEAALRRMNKEAMENISDEEIRMLGMGSGGY